MIDLPIQLSDTHCHLMLPTYDKDREQVIQRARAAGVMRVLVPGIDLATSKFAVELAAIYPEVYAAVGVHPHQAKLWDRSIEAEIRELAHQPKVVAIGEIGLDFFRNLSPPDQQRKAFHAQLAIAQDLHKPIIVHNREAMDEVLPTLCRWSEDLPDELAARAGVMHAYSGDFEAAQKAISAGFYLGVAGPVTYTKANGHRQLLSQLPAQRLLIETDAPYLTPHPFRNQRNEPAHVRLVAEGFAAALNISMQNAVDTTWQNAVELFNWNHEDNDRYVL